MLSCPQMALKDLQKNDTVTSFAQIIGIQVRLKRNGEAYARLILGDQSGRMEARLWDGVERFREEVEEGDFVKYRGVVQSYNGVNQLIISEIRKTVQGDGLDGFDAAKLIPSTENDVEQMWARLNSLVKENVVRSCLLDLLTSVLNAHEEKIKTYPAGVEVHHNYRGGLLEHILSVLESALYFAGKYPNVDTDLLAAGAVLHDIGKLEELSDAVRPAYTSRGQLIGHVVLGCELVGREASRIPDFPEDLLVRIQHIILSHQGQPEWGSPQVPKMLEALILHYVDDLDAKLNRFYRLQKEDVSDSDFTPFDRHLGRAVLKIKPGREDDVPLVASG